MERMMIARSHFAEVEVRGGAKRGTAVATNKPGD
jgi:hypothetical protein